MVVQILVWEQVLHYVLHRLLLHGRSGAHHYAASRLVAHLDDGHVIFAFASLKRDQQAVQ
jgi:hypothetical protein